MNQQTIALAGVAGDLGQRIAKALFPRGAAVRAIANAATLSLVVKSSG